MDSKTFKTLAELKAFCFTLSPNQVREMRLKRTVSNNYRVLFPSNKPRTE